MASQLGGWTGLILLLVVILLFAAPKLPQLARSLGQSMTIFKKEIRNKDGDDAPVATTSAESTVATPAPSVAPAAAKPEGSDAPSNP